MPPACTISRPGVGKGAGPLHPVTETLVTPDALSAHAPKRRHGGVDRSSLPVCERGTYPSSSTIQQADLGEQVPEAEQFLLVARLDQFMDKWKAVMKPTLRPGCDLVALAKRRAAVHAGGDGRRLSMLRWGLIPSWAREPNIG